MKTAISIPDPVFHEAESAAQRLSVSRSELYTKAIQAFLQQHAAADVTEKLNAVYADEPATVDPTLQEMQSLSLESDSW